MSLRQGWLCGLSAPVVLRGRGREVLAGRPERGLDLDLLLPGQVPLEVGLLWNLCSHWLSRKTGWP